MNTVFPSEPLSLKIMAWFLFPHIEKKLIFFVVKVFFLTQLLGFTSELGGPLPRQRLWRNSPRRGRENRYVAPQSNAANITVLSGTQPCSHREKDFFLPRVGAAAKNLGAHTPSSSPEV